ncbi:hypothetical protein EYF80_019153 [Liparis tanakae]|uniref:Uncharacterized protein n=1 Tax=Liparis tanakae TaxID=230148 RepID=A0A4Z2HXJ7_9TELE|nr:hypothetical protein EYF80_019153 [Liparis tanakae]
MEKNVLGETSFSPALGFTEKDTLNSKKLRTEDKNMTSGLNYYNMKQTETYANCCANTDEPTASQGHFCTAYPSEPPSENCHRSPGLLERSAGSARVSASAWILGKHQTAASKALRARLVFYTPLPSVDEGKLSFAFS